MLTSRSHYLCFALTLYSLLFGTISGRGCLAQDGSGSSSKPKATYARTIQNILQGFSVGKARILPYASIHEWFDPFVGVKVEHPAPWQARDRFFHHVQVEWLDDFSWKFRYAANSLSSEQLRVGLFFRTELDRDAYYYGIGNASVKSQRTRATYASLRASVNISKPLNDWIVVQWSPGFWAFKSGLRDGSEFELPSASSYVTSTLTFSDKDAIDYMAASPDNRWSFLIQLALPISENTSRYLKTHFETLSRFPVFRATRLALRTKWESLFAAERVMTPYFALPEIGSRNGLRGFSKERFRNFHVLNVNVELCIQIAREFEGFLLSDFAQTSSSLSALPRHHIHKNIGAGLRFLNNNKPIAVGLGYGEEGWLAFSTVQTRTPW